MELHKFERQLRLMMLLTQNRKYTLEELGKRLDMSSRNVYRYIEAFKMAGFIVRKTNGCYSLDKSLLILRIFPLWCISPRKRLIF